MVLASAPVPTTRLFNLPVRKVMFCGRVYKMKSLLQTFERMPSLSGGFICLLLVLTGAVPGALAITGAASTKTDWSTVFEQPDASPLVKGKLLTSIPVLGKQWRVSFEVFPENFDHTGLASVLHLRTGEHGNKFGRRIPAVLIQRNKRVLVSTALGKKLIFNKRFRSKNGPALRRWTKIEVGQSLQGEDYIYSIDLGGRQVFTANNSRPRDFYDVKVYAASPSSPPLSGSIRNLKIEVGGEKPFSLEKGISLNSTVAVMILMVHHDFLCWPLVVGNMFNHGSHVIRINSLPLGQHSCNLLFTNMIFGKE